VNRLFLQAHRYSFGIILFLALIMRVLVPAGWMPSDAKGQMITICTGTGTGAGMGVSEAWLGNDGKIHKQAPPKKSHGDQPCVFAGLSAASMDSATMVLAVPPVRISTITPYWGFIASVGHGLAAPPPYSTGPPSLI
jgi:hypothetical protein